MENLLKHAYTMFNYIFFLGYNAYIYTMFFLGSGHGARNFCDF